MWSISESLKTPNVNRRRRLAISPSTIGVIATAERHTSRVPLFTADSGSCPKTVTI
ncbi:MAG: hypothetical protein PUB49_09520 [Selenomonadaceae bacterium]|nr:hypothetical protein [Selenomonadaceae bacterium]